MFISPHYFYPTDDGWKINGPLEADEFKTRTFARSGPLNLTGFTNSGADWLDRFKPQHRRRQDDRRQSAQSVRTADQRSGATATQTRDRQDHSRRHAGKYVRRIASA